MPKRPKTETQLAAEAEQQRINKLWFIHMGDEHGAAELLEDLERNFPVRSPLKRDKNGRVDAEQTLANCGALEVISWIRQRIQLGSESK